MGHHADSPVTAIRRVFSCFRLVDSKVTQLALGERVPFVMHRFAIEESDPDSDLRVIAVVGELDLAVADQLQGAIDRAADAPGVLVDLCDCEFLDSTGIAILIRGREALAAEGRCLTICNPRSQVLRVLEVTGLTRLDGFVADPLPDPAPSP